MVLMQMFKNLERNTLLAQEILVLIREHKLKNVLVSEGFTRKMSLNFNMFNFLIPSSCFIDELQYIIFGVFFPPKKDNNTDKLQLKINKKKLSK